MAEWWEGLMTIEKVYWCFAIPSTIIFLIMMVLTFVGGDTDPGLETDVEIEADAGVGFQFISVKSLLGFFTVFSWAGLSCIDAGYTTGTTITISALAGLAMMAAVATMFYFMTKLQDSGTLDMRNAIDGIGEVYLRIPGERGGMGKVQIKIQGSLRELEALTDDIEALERGMVIRVTNIVSENILLVTKEK